MSDVTLFTMAALIQQNNGNQAAALAQFNANYNAGTSTLNQAFVDQILAQEDILAGCQRPADDVLGHDASQQPDGEYPRA